NAAASIAWADWLSRIPRQARSSFYIDFCDFVHANCLALALPCAVWLLLEKRWSAGDFLPGYSKLSLGCHRLASMLAVVLLAIVPRWGLMCGGLEPPGQWLAWSATLAVIAAVLVNLWDPKSRFVVMTLYVVGLITIGKGIVQLSVTHDRLLPTSACFVAAF